MTYQTYFQNVTTLSWGKIRAMADLYFMFYEGSSLEVFLKDLKSKSEVLFLEHENKVIGFSTLEFYSFKNKLIVYSGDTIVDPNHWKQQSLHSAWIERIGQLKIDHPITDIYWLLLVKGHRTYKYLTIFAKEFFPHWENDYAHLKMLADELATHKFGHLYNKVSGIVECPSTYGHLKHFLTPISKNEQHKTSNSFFLKTNPLYYQGHELVCICKISEDNLQSRFRSLFLNPKIRYRNE